MHYETSNKLSSQRAPSFLEPLSPLLTLSSLLSKKDLNSPFLNTSQTPSTSLGRGGRNLDADFHTGVYPTPSVKVAILYFIKATFGLINNHL